MFIKTLKMKMPQCSIYQSTFGSNGEGAEIGTTVQCKTITITLSMTIYE